MVAGHIGLVLIGNESDLRNPSLLQTVNPAMTYPQIVIGVFPRDALEAEPWSDPEAQVRLLGRRLSTGEVGCWASHRLAYEWGESMELAWVVILEDDALPHADLLPLVESMTSGWKSPENPAIIQLFSMRDTSQRPQGRPAESPFRLSGPEPTTTAYVINREAIRLALQTSREAATTADWPAWAANCDFYSVSANLVSALEGESLLGRRESPVLRGRLSRAVQAAIGVTLLREQEHFLGLGNYWRYFIVGRLRSTLRRISSRAQRWRASRWRQAGPVR